MLELFKKMQTVFGPAPVKNGESKSLDAVEILKQSYQGLSSLAEQIHSHAERAPYPHVAQRLRKIAAENRSSANLLRDKILESGKKPEEAPLDTRSGKNHWERMVQDLNDQKELETRFLERAAVLDEESPQSAALLRQIAALQRPHIDALLDLIVRADPQAEQT